MNKSEARKRFLADPIKKTKWVEAVKNRDMSFTQTPEYAKKISEGRKGKGLGSSNGKWKGGTWNWAKRLALKRDNFVCQKCGFSNNQIMVVDHIVPKRKATNLIAEVKNLQTLCPNCHALKTLEDRKKYPQKQRNQFSE